MPIPFFSEKGRNPKLSSNKGQLIVNKEEFYGMFNQKDFEKKGFVFF